MTFKQLWLFLLVWLAPIIAYAQDDNEPNWPTIVTEATDLKMFVPKGWYLEWDTVAPLIPAIKECHLFVLRQMDTVNRPPLGARSLHIIVKDSTGLFRLITSNRSLLQWGEEGMLHFWDLQGSIWVRNNGVVVERIWLNGKALYRFRYDTSSQKFMLIGLEYDDQGRNGSPRLQDSRNYLTGKRHITYSRMDMRPPYHYEEPLEATTKIHGHSTSLSDTDPIEMDADAFTYDMLRLKWVPEDYEEQEQMLDQLKDKRKKR